MEVDRIHQVHGLKVERTGSESERRRHQRPDEEFNELLEQSLKDGENSEQRNSASRDSSVNHPPAAAYPPVTGPEVPVDTVSLSTAAPAAPAVSTDIVSLSPAARVSSESLKATSGALRLSLVQLAALSLRGLAATHPGSNTPEIPPPPETEPADPAPPAPTSVDTVA